MIRSSTSSLNSAAVRNASDTVMVAGCKVMSEKSCSMLKEIILVHICATCSSCYPSKSQHVHFKPFQSLHRADNRNMVVSLNTLEI